MPRLTIAAIGFAILAVSGQATAQSDALSRLATVGESLDLAITDPDDIAAVCGGDAGMGEPLWVAHCADCHALTAEAPAGIGPHLYAVFGRTPGTVEGYDYSPALAAAATEGWIWERETMHAYAEDPAHFLPGTVKDFAGLADEQTRAHLFTYLRTATTPPPPPPGSVEVPAEVLAMEGDIAYGEYLASECLGCHKAGQDATGGVPNIVGWPREAFITALFEYRLGSRPNQTMVNITRRLSDEEIVALAAYFETIQ